MSFEVMQASVKAAGRRSTLVRAIGTLPVQEKSVTPKQRQEELSRVYLHAVAAKCGFALGSWTQDQSCIDVTVGASGVLGEGTLSDPKLDVQLKCTASEAKVREHAVSVQLERAQYDRLVAKSSVPKILVVLVLPKNEEQWVEHSSEQLILRRCAYFLRTTGMPPFPTEKDSTVVQVPLQNEFSPGALQAMLERLSRGEAV